MHMMMKLLGFPQNPDPFAISLQSIKGIFMHLDLFLLSPGDLPDPGIEPGSLAAPALQVDSLPEPLGKL